MKFLDANTHSLPIWLGVVHRENISNRLSKDNKKIEYHKFVDKCQSSVTKSNLSDFAYFERIGHVYEKYGYSRAIKNRYGEYESADIILVGIKNPYELKNWKNLTWIVSTSILGTLVWFLLVTIPPIDKKE